MTRGARGGQRGAGRARGDGRRRRRPPPARASSCWRRSTRTRRSRSSCDRNGPGMQQMAYRVDDVEAGLRASCASAACGCSTTRPARHRRLADQLRPPQGRRRRARRAGRARRARGLTPPGAAWDGARSVTPCCADGLPTSTSGADAARPGTPGEHRRAADPRRDPGRRTRRRGLAGLDRARVLPRRSPSARTRSDMFEGLATARQGPAQVAARRRGPDPRARARARRSSR